MEPTVVDITKLSMDQLKSMAYDRIQVMEQTRVELTQLQNEMQLRAKNPVEPAKPEPTPP